MKRMSLVLALVLVLSLSVGAFAGNWIDGTYEGYSDAGARSFQYAKVYIENGEIVAVTLREFTDRYLERILTTTTGNSLGKPSGPWAPASWKLKERMLIS